MSTPAAYRSHHYLGSHELFGAIAADAQPLVTCLTRAAETDGATIEECDVPAGEQQPRCSVCAPRAKHLRGIFSVRRADEVDVDLAKLLDDRVVPGTDAAQLGELPGCEHFAVLDEVGEVRLPREREPDRLAQSCRADACEERQLEERMGYWRHRLRRKQPERGEHQATDVV